MKLFFWRRFAAAWIDVFVVYSAVSLALGLGALVGLRVALEPLFVAVAAAYGVVFLWCRGQTVGKELLGLALDSTSGRKPSKAKLLAREVLGKWLLSVVVPVAAGRALLKNAWVPSVFDGMVLGLMLVFLLIYSLLARRPWYDAFAGTVVCRVPGTAGFPRTAALVLLFAAVLGWGCKAVEYAARRGLPCRLTLHQSMRSTKPYIQFLARGTTGPVDYVLSLFERYDVVVLCERPHPEASQWDFIFDVVKDPRFAERVGHVFTEYGNTWMQPRLEEFMATDGLSPAQVQQHVVHLMRNFSVWPTWPNVNFYTYLTRLYDLNQSLPAARRIHHHFTDVAVDWGERTAATMPEHWRLMGDRDEYMANRVVEEMRRLAPADGRPAKCLVVMNFRHAFDLTDRRPEARRKNTYEFIKDAFQERAANVLLNTSVVLVAPIAGGAWDAAFERAGNRPAGFDFAGSPFGEDRFDLFIFAPPIQSQFRYRDVFTGFVFAHPLKDQYALTGIPGYFAGFEPEMRRRAALVGEDYSKMVEQMIRREQRGQVNVRDPLLNFRVETLIEVVLLGLAGVGLLIGLARLVVLRRSGQIPSGALHTATVLSR